ncbi:hypothetical protein N7G274_008871 [Stereocaulon virgatum]|uniref:Derlin n=1 Tax=Stereocaulon virgatum TaxID=373712 RepID=A0ABR3ZXV4_9LECA
MDGYWAAPPVSRTLTALTAVTSCLVYGGLLDPYRIIFYLPSIFKFPLPEIWRFFSCFWLTGPQLSILFDTYFLWTYSSALEKGSGRFSHPGDFFVYIIFLGLVIVATAGGILGGMVFTQALILGIAYTYAQDNKGKKATFFIISFNVMWLPWAMLLMTFVMAGTNSAMNPATGIVAARLCVFRPRLWPEFGGGKNYIFTPNIVQRWFGGDRPNIQGRGYGTAYRQAAPAPGRGTSSGFGFASAWGTRGQGRRLGGD